MNITVDITRLTLQDLETIDSYLDGNTLTTRPDLVALFESAATKGASLVGSLTDTQLRRVAQSTRRQVTDEVAANLKNSPRRSPPTSGPALGARRPKGVPSEASGPRP